MRFVDKMKKVFDAVTLQRKFQLSWEVFVRQ